MKKFVLLLSALFAISCAHNVKYDKEFKNPVFNQPLRPLSRTTGFAYLTPVSVVFSTLSDPDKISYSGKCDLLENEQDHITLKCKTTLYGGESTDYYKYAVKEQFTSDCLRIEETVYEAPDSKVSSDSYCVKD